MNLSNPFEQKGMNPVIGYLLLIIAFTMIWFALSEYSLVAIFDEFFALGAYVLCWNKGSRWFWSLLHIEAGSVILLATANDDVGSKLSTVLDTFVAN